MTTIRRYALALCALAGCANGDSLKALLQQQPRLPPADPWQDYRLLQEGIDIDSVVATPDAEGISRAITQLEEIAAIVESDAFGDDIPACYRQQEVADYVSASAQKLLWANRGLRDEDHDGRVYGLATLVGRTNYTSLCGGAVVGGVHDAVLVQERDDSGHDTAEDGRLWHRYQVIISHMEAESRLDEDAAFKPHVVPYLEELAAIASRPELSCDHADAIREKANFVAPNVLTLYRLRGQGTREDVVRLGKVIAATEAAYGCVQKYHAVTGMRLASRSVRQ